MLYVVRMTRIIRTYGRTEYNIVIFLYYVLYGKVVVETVILKGNIKIAKRTLIVPQILGSL